LKQSARWVSRYNIVVTAQIEFPGAESRRVVLLEEPKRDREVVAEDLEGGWIATSIHVGHVDRVDYVITVNRP